MNRMRASGLVPLWLLILAVALASCAPRITSASFDTPEGIAIERVAEIAYHRMEIGRLETGSYTTNVLIDLDLPRGVRWMVVDFTVTSYGLHFTSDTLPDVAWLVSPEGVHRIATAN